MTRYARMFERLEGEREAALGAFLMLGDPGKQASARLLDALVEGGANMIEVGIPFSDPVADGPVIQAAGVRALANGATPADCFAVLKAFRARHAEVPVGILTYANLVLARGRDDFYARAAEAEPGSAILVGLSGRGDKDVAQAERLLS